MQKSTIEKHFAGEFLSFYRHFIPSIKPGSNGSAQALCPFHRDKTPSMSIQKSTGLFHCHACGAQGSAFDFYALKNGLDPKRNFNQVIAGIAETFNITETEGPAKTRAKVVARYDYRSADGSLAYQIERLEPKSFRIRRPEGNGWIYNSDDIELIPYHLPEIIKAAEVIVVEGEKDGDNLAVLGFAATTNPFGAGKWPEHFGKYFTGKHVVVIPDNDTPGREHAAKVVANIKGKAASIKWLELPDLPDKGDVSDLIATFQDTDAAAERLSVMIEGAPEYKDTPTPDTEKEKRFHFITAAELCGRRTPDNFVIKPYIENDSVIVTFGESGSGKSFVGFDVGLCIASETPWHGHAINKPGSVFYIAGEGYAGIMRRISAHAKHHGYSMTGLPFFISDRPARILEKDSIKTIQEAIDELANQHGQPVLIIIDTLNRNFGPGDENSTADMTKFIEAIDTIRVRYQCAIMIIHHSGLMSTERARGASALRAALDWEFRLVKNADGTRILTCTKAKDYEAPPDLSFALEEITLDWADETGSPMTSCVLKRIEDVTLETVRHLHGAKKIAFDCLKSLGGQGVDVDEWRLACYSAGISPTSSTEAKRKAFKRAAADLRDAGLVIATNDLWTTKEQTGHFNHYNYLQEKD